MSTITRSLDQASSQLRPFDVSKDLNAVADLVETCFADTLDEDGRRYLDNMHAAARNPGYLRWALSVADNTPMPFSGYVWEENGYLAGNLSLIPYKYQGKRCYLIANVAVDPAYRRRGIAGALTAAAIDHARARGAAEIWLHVREENIAAQNLYRSIGFKEQARRTTWEIKPRSLVQPIPAGPPGIDITHPDQDDWDQYRRWSQLGSIPPLVPRDLSTAFHLAPAIPLDRTATWFHRQPESFPESHENYAMGSLRTRATSGCAGLATPLQARRSSLARRPSWGGRSSNSGIVLPRTSQAH
jgi:ribosomal protein S18 acetylase RimI-like enzyme